MNVLQLDADRVARHLVELGVRSAFLLALTLLLASCMLRTSSAVRHQWLAAGMLGSLLIPVVMLCCPVVPILSYLPNAAIDRGQLLQPSIDVAQPDSDSKTYLRELDGAQTSRRADHDDAVGDRGAVILPTQVHQTVLWPWLVIVTWLLGALATITPMIIGMVQLGRIIRLSLPCDDPRINVVARQVTKRTWYRVMLCHQSMVPLAYGLFRAAIILPAESRQWSADQLNAVLRHEIGHSERGDQISLLIGHLARAIYWYDPLVWLCFRRMRAEQERACDDRVLTSGVVDGPEYAQWLVDVATTGRLPRSVASVVPTMGRSDRLHKRIAAVLSSSVSRAPLSNRWLFCSCLFGCMATIVAGAISTDSNPTPIEQRPSVATSSPDEDKEMIPTEESQVGETVNSDADGEVTAEESILGQRLRALQREWARQFEPIRSARLKYNRIVSYRSPKPLDPEAVGKIIEQVDLENDPMILATLAKLLLPDNRQGQEIETTILYSDGAKSRAERSYGERLEYIEMNDGSHVVFYCPTNEQVNLSTPRDTRRHYASLQDFYPYAPMTDSLKGAKVSVIKDGRIILRGEAKHSGTTLSKLLEVDETTGLVVHNRSTWGDQVSRDRWVLPARYAQRFVFPRVLIDVRYSKNQANLVEITQVLEAKFNLAIPGYTFVVGAPARSVIVDERADDNLLSLRRDVHDLTSDSEVEAAALKNYAPSDVELASIAFLKPLYHLAKGQRLRYIGPPLPPARKYAVNLFSPGAVPMERPFAFLFEQHDDGLKLGYQWHGVPTVQSWLDALTDAKGLEIEGDRDLLRTSMEGDMVVDPNATDEELLPEMAKILSNELQVPVDLKYGTVDRPVFIVTGDFHCKTKTPDEITRRDWGKTPHVILHDGDATDQGSVFGYGARDMLFDIECMIGVPLVDATSGVPQELTYETRDRSSINVDEFLRLLTEQTGLKFELKTRPARRLFLRRKSTS